MVVVAACVPSGGEPAGPLANRVDQPELRRLTQIELRRSLRYVLGDIEVEVTEPDLFRAGFARVGARDVVTSQSAVERLTLAVESSIDRVFTDDARRAALLGCDPSSAACIDSLIAELGPKAWRRPLDSYETERLRSLAARCTELSGSAVEGSRCVVSGLLLSPNFLYRVELSEPNGEFRGYAMASRLSYLLWSAPPDATLLAAAEAGELDTADGIRTHAARMLDDARAREGLRSFVDEWYRLDRLERLERDVLVYTSEEVQFALADAGELNAFLTKMTESAREELRRMVVDNVLDQRADYLDLLTTDRTFVNRELEIFYNLRFDDEGGAASIVAPGYENVEDEEEAFSCVEDCAYYCRDMCGEDDTCVEGCVPACTTECEALPVCQAECNANCREECEGDAACETSCATGCATECEAEDCNAICMNDECPAECGDDADCLAECGVNCPAICEGFQMGCMPGCQAECDIECGGDAACATSCTDRCVPDCQREEEGGGSPEECRRECRSDCSGECGDDADCQTECETGCDIDCMTLGPPLLTTEGPADEAGWMPARHSAQSPRRGVIGTMAFLSQLGKQQETSPTRRGLYVMEHLACLEVGDPPDEIDLCERPDGVTRRQSMEEHHVCAASCGGCHRQMDPLGFALDGFDTIGRIRLVDDWGFPLDTTVQWTLASNGSTTELNMDGLRSMADTFRNRPETEACVTRQLFRFANGVEEPDEAVVEEMATEFRREGRRLRDFILYFVGTASFRRAAVPNDALPIEPTVSAVGQRVFGTRCAPCHVGETLGSLDLRNDAGLAERLSRPSSIGMPLITPGDLSRSYLWQKVQGTHAEVGGDGDPMPPTGSPLTPREVEGIQRMIEAM